MLAFKVLSKVITEGIGIIIVIMAVVVFSYFDPFNWFEPKPKIENTALLVKEVKEIQELITAEYFGETLTSWPRVSAESKEEEDKANIMQMIFNLNDELIQGNEKNIDRNGSRVEWKDKDVWSYYKRNLRDQYKDSELFKAIVRVTAGGENRGSERATIVKIYNKGDEYVPPDLDVKRIHSSFRAAIGTSRSERRKDAVCIARGIVRAGVDLSQIDKKNISISNQGVVYISNAPIRIFSTEMNPWFIPQKKIKGFELVKLKGKIERQDVFLLKSRCRDMILQQALDRKIKQQAKQNAEEALLNFVNLIFTEPVKEIVLVTDRLDELRLQFENEDVFTPEQIVFLYNECNLYMRDKSDSTGYKDFEALRNFIQHVKQKRVQWLTTNENSSNQTLQTQYRSADIYTIKAIQSQVERSAPDSIERVFIGDYWLDGKTDFDSTQVHLAALAIDSIMHKAPAIR